MSLIRFSSLFVIFYRSFFRIRYSRLYTDRYERNDTNDLTCESYYDVIINTHFPVHSRSRIRESRLADRRLPVARSNLQVVAPSILPVPSLYISLGYRCTRVLFFRLPKWLLARFPRFPVTRLRTKSVMNLDERKSFAKDNGPRDLRVIIRYEMFKYISVCRIPVE